MSRLSAIALAVLITAGCGPSLSNEITQRAVKAPFKAVQENISEYEGKTFVWGGYIANATHEPGETLIEIIENPGASGGGIVDPDISGGRFVASFPGFLDSSIYRPGRIITVGGAIAGSKIKQVENMSYSLPVLKAEEHFLWNEDIYPQYRRQRSYLPYGPAPAWWWEKKDKYSY